VLTDLALPTLRIDAVDPSDLPRT
ncbi:hypothetical protein LCGC14_2783330, partial [marine sediment metagenome]